MKYINLLLIISVILCYTGLGAGISRSQDPSNNTSCHATRSDRVSGAESRVHSPRNNDSVNHGACICHDALTSATYNHDIDQKNIILSSAMVNTPILDIIKVSDFRLNFDARKNNQPLELYLANSSFLL